MAKDYKITRQTLDTDINPEGTGFERVWQTHYKVTNGAATGTTGFVRMPTDMHNAENVHAAVSTAVNELNKVAAL
jgi:hypothetical protein